MKRRIEVMDDIWLLIVVINEQAILMGLDLQLEA